MEALLILIALAIPVLGIAGFFMALGARDRVRKLEATVAQIEARLNAIPPLAPAPRPAAEAAPETPAPEALTPERTPPEPAAEQAAAVEPKPIREAFTPPKAPPTAPAGSAHTPGFEERFGTRWVVWVGGLALALGGIFLVRYSIEQGLIGPGLRVFFGALLAAALVGAGEWARRREIAAAVGGFNAAHIPSILTAAGTTVAYATVYAAYALYGFLPPPVAFVVLGIVALATLAAALLHGPALAGLGLVGAYVAPLLVATGEPSYWALYLYLAVVTAAACALARARMWRWLAVTALAFSIAWMFPGLSGPSVAAHAFHALTGLALVAVFIVAGLFLGPPAVPGRIDAISSAAVAAFVVLAGLLVVANRHEGIALAAFTLSIVAAVAIAWRTESALGAVPVAGLCASLVMAHWAVEFDWETLVAPSGATAAAVPDPQRAVTGGHLALGAAYVALFGGSGYLAQGRIYWRALSPMLWAATAVAAPLAILAAVYYKIAGFSPSIPFAGLALVLAALYAVATETLNRRPMQTGLAAATAIFAVGSIAALALALTLALEKGWLTVALALMVPGIAWVGDKRPLRALRWVAALMIAVILVRLAWQPRIVGRDVGTMPIFNWLLWGYGVPALSFWLGGHLLRRRADDVPTRIVESAAILFTALTGLLQIRHYMNNGDVFRNSAGLAEVAMQVSTGLAMVIGLEWVRERTRSVVHDIGALVVALLVFATVVIGLCLVDNPLFTGEPVGGRVINLILLGYGIPAVLTIVLALMTRTTRPSSYRAVAAVTAVGMALLYLTLEVRRFYHGPNLETGGVSNAEQYTYSVVWLVFGVALLLIGILLRAQPARLASAAVVLVTVGKVFLIDLADLEGFYRAVSFIGLGLVLVGIGVVYQRLLFRPQPPAADGGTATPVQTA